MARNEHVTVLIRLPGVVIIRILVVITVLVGAGTTLPRIM
jgi:hypothetical protein